LVSEYVTPEVVGFYKSEAKMWGNDSWNSREATTFYFVDELINIFFQTTHTQFPFLNREVFNKLLPEKKLDTMLVNAVCAVASRYHMPRDRLVFLPEVVDDILPSGKIKVRTVAKYGQLCGRLARNEILGRIVFKGKGLRIVC